MSDPVPTVLVFAFDHGAKRVDECDRDELLTVIRYLAEENERLVKAAGTNRFRRADMLRRHFASYRVGGA